MDTHSVHEWPTVGAAPKQAAPTASDTSSKGPGVQSVADPANVEQALDSVGDAVENAVPDPKGAESGLAPTADKQVSTTDSGKYPHCLHSLHWGPLSVFNLPWGHLDHLFETLLLCSACVRGGGKKRGGGGGLG